MGTQMNIHGVLTRGEGLHRERIETLADLEKEVHCGRTPEQVVGSLAYKTPDLQSYMAAHHGTLLWADLHGQKVPMDGRIPRTGGRYVTLDGKQGVIFERTPEEEAFLKGRPGGRARSRTSSDMKIDAEQL